jgi:predicted Ser/Thr protein kinase
MLQARRQHIPAARALDYATWDVICHRRGTTVAGDDNSLKGMPAETAPAVTAGPGQLTTGQMLGDRYQVEREFGRGAMGVVYLARDLQLLGADSTRVVIKVLQDEALRNPYTKKKFFQEFESLTRVNHPNVVKVLGRGTVANGLPFFAMEFVDGESLREIIPPEGMDLDRAAGIVRQIGNALTAVHDRGILHCDLKPANIMIHTIDDEDRVKLIDFGVAKVKDSTVVEGGTTKMLGTLNYASPEHFAGTFSPMSDVYCFGLVAYEMVTGRRPFNPANEAHLCSLQDEGVKVNPRDLRPMLSSSAQDAILKALSRDPRDRFPRARDFGEALAKALSAPALGWKSSSSSASGHRAGLETGNRAPVLQVAYVLFIELVDYAAMPMDRQVDAMGQLEQIVRASRPVQSAEVDQSLILLPSGEGLGLVFLGDPTAPIQCASEVAAELKSRPDIRYRMGMHSAPVYLTTDNDARRNVGGGCVAMAKLITEYGDTGHILLSSSLADILAQIGSWAPHLADLGERSISQGVKVHLHSFRKGELGNVRAPAHGAASGTSDVLPDLLASARFEAGAAGVLGEAARLARESRFREVTTSHLFAAMVSGANPHLRNVLTRKGIRTEALQSFLAKLLAKAPGSNVPGTGSGTIRLKWSRNAESVLLRATEVAAAAHRDRVSELDLLRGFAGQPESSVREILRVLHVSVSDLDPDLPSPAASVAAPAASKPVDRIGPLGEKDCSAEAWAALLQAAAGRDSLTTADLLTGPLAGTLERFGLQGTAASRTQSATRNAAQGEIRCSKNAGEILSRALGMAAPGTVGMTNLLMAFIETGGGSSGEAIRARGVKLEWLTSELFVDHGRLDLTRLAPPGRLVLEQAFELAYRRNDAKLSRDHLLYALASVEGGYLARCLSQGRKNAGNLASLVLASLAPAKAAKRRIALVLSDTEHEAIEVLCQAERMAQRSQQAVGDEHLVCALASVGVSATTRKVLESNGITLDRVVPATDRRNPPSA